MPRSVADGCWGLLAQRYQAALSFALLLLSYTLYLLIGAGIFSAIELPYEQRLREELKLARQEFLVENSCVSDARLEELLARALEASNYGVSVLGNDTGEVGANWDFVSSLFFTSTVLTTTGYGHTVPLSDGGKAFCVIYAVCGIPVTLFFLSAVVQRIMILVTRRPVSYFHHRWGMSRSKLATIHAACLSTLMALLLLIIPAWIFVTMEKDWSYLESLYFCFISLTTIGLGDYVPGETHSREANPHRQLYRLGITIYLILGLVCMLVVLETCCELPRMRSLRHMFYAETTRDLDSETTTIIDRDQTNDQAADAADDMMDRLPVVSSVSQQAASIDQLIKASVSPPNTQAQTSSANGNLT